MKNIYNYLEENKNVSCQEKPWNIMDNLLCACFAYMPITYDFSFKTFDDLCDEILNYKYPPHPEYVSYTNKKIFKILKNSIRYQELKFVNYVNIIDDNTQFGALTCLIGKKKIICFKGSDGSIIAWIENLRLIYSYPTYTQAFAINYLKQNIHVFDPDITVLGHSKGGNLALISAMEQPWYKRIKIKKVLNFDGPGLKWSEYTSKKYKKISHRLENYIPNKSYVGVLMYSDNLQVVDTNALMIGVHYPTNWKIDKGQFIFSKLSNTSHNLHLMTTDNLKDMNINIVKNILETIFETFESKKKEHVAITLRDISNIITKIKNTTVKEKEYLLSLIKSMFNLSENK